MPEPPEKTVLFVYNTGLSARLLGQGAFRGQQWQLGAGTFSIGRDATNDLPLATEPGVSKVHCKITVEDGQYVVADAESRNGTLVNGVPVKRHTLQSGDEIQVCDALFRFAQDGHLDNAAPPQRASPQPEHEPAEPVRAGAPVRRPPRKKASNVPWFLGGMVSFLVMVGGMAWLMDLLPIPSPLGAPPERGVASAPPATDTPNEGTTTDAAAASGPDSSVETDPGSASGAATPPAGSDDGAPAGEKAAAVEANKDPAAKKEGDRAKAKATAVGLSGPLEHVPARGGSVEVKHSLNAKVTTLPARAGARVRRGATLLTYEDGGARKQLAAAREAYNRLKEAAVDTEEGQQELADAKAAVEKAAAAAAPFKLVAPQTANVTDVRASVGETAQKGEVAVVMNTGADEAWRVKVRLDFKSPGRWKVGAKTTVDVDGTAVEALVSRAAGGWGIVTLRKPPQGLTEGQTVVVAPPR